MRKIFTLLAAVLLCAAMAQPAFAGQCMVRGENYSIGAKGAVVMEAQTGRVLFAENADHRLPMASTTKIMTALLTLEQPELDEEFEVDSQAIITEGSSMGLMEGDIATLRALAGGMMMASGNDGANAAAVRIAGSMEDFSQLMNERAAQIGMKNTHFVTPSGLDDKEHYSTAYDMALLAREALKNPDFAQMATSKRLTLTYGNPPYKRTLANHNRLLSSYPGAVGVKTGFTKKSGRCLVSAATKNGVTLIIVTLNCGNDWNTHAALYDRYFAMVESVEVTPEKPIMVPVTGGTLPYTQAKQISPVTAVSIAGEKPQVHYTIYAPFYLYAPVLGGDIVGKIVYDRDGIIIGESMLAAAVPVPALPSEPEPEPGLWQRIADWWNELAEKDTEQPHLGG